MKALFHEMDCRWTTQCCIRRIQASKTSQVESTPPLYTLQPWQRNMPLNTFARREHRLRKPLEGAIHEIGQEKKIKTRRQDLANMARVCKAFSSSAIDVLWKNLDDFEDLLHVFPFYQDWGDRVSSQFSTYLTAELTRRILPKDCLRDSTSYVGAILDVCTPCSWPQMDVLAISFGDPQDGVDVARVPIWCPVTPLLPRLQALTLLNIDPHFVQPLVLLLTPSLRTFTLSFGDSESTGSDEVAPMVTRSSGE